MNFLAVDPFWLIMLGKVAAAFTSLAVLNLYIVKPFRKNVIGKGREFYNKVVFIETELRPNSGGSLRDAVNNIHAISVRLDQRQRNFFQFDPHGIFEMTVDGTVIWINRAFMEILRRHPEEVMGYNWRSCIIEADRPRVIAEWDSAVKDKRDFLVRMTMLDTDHNQIPVEARALKMLDPDGKLLGHLGFLVRTDEPPPGCRWCQSLEDLARDNVELRKHLDSVSKDRHLRPLPKKSG